MRNILLLTCSVCLISTMTIADDTIPETCAGGAGTINIGKITGKKYCVSNNSMNWWNANAWCDGMGMRLFHLNDCKWEYATSFSNCPEAKGFKLHQMAWTTSADENNKWHIVEDGSGYIKYTYEPHSLRWYALCAPK